MTKKISRRSLLLVAGLLGPLPALADPPFRDVLFQLPLALTDLPAIISKVAVECEVTISEVLPQSGNGELIRTGRAEFNVVDGAVNQTAQVLVTVPSITRKETPVSNPVTSYTCTLLAFLEEGLGWNSFERPSTLSAGNTSAPSVLNLTVATSAASQSSMPSRGHDLTGRVQWPTSP